LFSLGSILLIILALGALIFAANRYRRCPSNKVIVVYGKVGGGTARCVHGGGVFVWPLIQDYAVLSLEPMTMDIDLRGALSKGNIRVSIPATVTFGISKKQGILQNAAERLLGLEKKQIISQASDITLGQLRLVIATLSIEEINQDREKFLDLVNSNVNGELQKLGLEVINVNIRDITDESGYIDAIGKKAAAEAINKAKTDPSFSYEEWYRENHVYNPYTRRYEPLDCWTTTEFNEKALEDIDLHGEWVPKGQQRQNKIKNGDVDGIYVKSQDMRNKNYKEGVGLGLSVARRIARQLGGDVILDTRYKEGSRFILQLPKE
jgi:hypothetical protein